MKTVAILGAGPMGLATAYHLAKACHLHKAGYRPIVLEKDAEPGGMSASFNFDGVRLEKYYHFINKPDTDLFALLRELDMEDSLRWTDTKMGFFRPAPHCTQSHDSQSEPKARLYPWGNPLALLRFDAVPLATRLRYGFHVMYCKYLNDLMPLDDKSAADWIRAWEGQEGYDCLWRSLFEKKFFDLAHPLSAAWIASRVRRVARSRKNLMREQLGYLHGGSESLVERLVESIKAHGGEVRTSWPVGTVRTKSPVGSVRAEGNGFVILPGDAHKGKDPIAVDAVISTVPLPTVSALFPFLPASYTERVRKIANIGVACALFRLQKPLSSNFWLNIDMPGWDVPGIIEYSNLRPMNAAHVYVPFYMPRSHPNWQADDTTLLHKARGYLASINPHAAATEEAARIFRYEYAQPVCQPGFRHVLPPYDTGVPGLFIADTAHSFPEDRSIQESVRIGKELAATLCGTTQAM